MVVCIGSIEVENTIMFFFKYTYISSNSFIIAEMHKIYLFVHFTITGINVRKFLPYIAVGSTLSRARDKE